MFALGMRRVLEFLRSMSWMVRRAGTRQGEKRGGGEREGPGADGADGRRNQDAEPRAGRWGRVQDGGWRVRELEGGPWRACHRTERGQDKAVIPFPGAQTAGHQLNCEADA